MVSTGSVKTEEASRGPTSSINSGKAYNCQRRIRTRCLVKK